jgi:prolipoprotein diacylglyceryltransferase
VRPELVAVLSRLMPGPIAEVVAPTWFTMVGLAGVVALGWMLRAARRAGIDQAVIARVVLWGYVAAVGCGIAIPMGIDAIEQVVRTGHARWRWAGMTSFWGYLGGAIAVSVVARRAGVSPGRLADLAAVPLGVALGLTRLGCFVAGCDYGKVTSGPWATRFPAGSPAWRDHVRSGLVPVGRDESLPVHPTQLYEAALGVVIAVVAFVVARRAWARAGHGRVFLVGAAVYAIGRFWIENLRGDVGRGLFGPLSSGQVFALVVLAAIGGFVAWAWRRRAAAVVAAAAAAVVATATAGPAHADEIGPAPPSGVRDRWLAAGVLVGVSAPLNRRSGQVPPLAGPSVSVGLQLPRSVSAWLDLDSLGNQDASHGTLLVSLSFDRPLRGAWTFAPRFGLGTTLVNFDAPAFRDVAGLTLRAEGSFEVELSARWTVWARPLSFDLLTADDLGGPILAWQLRVGIAYQLPTRRRAITTAPPSSAPPAPPPSAPRPSPEPPAPAPAPAPAPIDPYGAGAFR